MKLLQKAVFFFSVVILCASCAGQNSVVSNIVQDYENEAVLDRLIETKNILETQDGYGASDIPKWLSAYINGGIEEVEEISLFKDKYFFISRNEGSNLKALSKWANNYSPEKDFPRLVASRIEERMISASALYPENDYGIFFETLVKKARSFEYPAAAKEDIYWIKTIGGKENDSSEVYEYFVILSIEKTALQNQINSIMKETLTVVKQTRAQNTAIKSLQQFFFEGF